MKKNIIIPIVAALMAMIAGLCATAAIYQNDGNVSYDAHEARHATVSNSTDDIFLINTYEEFIKFCLDVGARFLYQNGQDCSCYLCVKLREYDSRFFKRNALIVTAEKTPDTDFAFAVDKINVKNQSLNIELLCVDLSCFGYMTQGITTDWTLFFDVKKSDIKEVTSIEKKVTKIEYGDLLPNKVLIELVGFPKSYWTDAINGNLYVY